MRYSIKDDVYSRAGGICSKCGCHIDRDKAKMQYIIPREQGGKNIADNMALCCPKCYHDPRATATAKYMAKTYDRLDVRIRKGERAKIAEFAAKHGLSVNNLVITVLNKYATDCGEKLELSLMDTEKRVKQTIK